MVETKFQTSFIPKQPVTEEVNQPGGGNILFLIGFLFLVANIAMAAGVFLWQHTIATSINKGNEQLNASKAAFDNNTINKYTKLNDRIVIAESLLTEHVGPSRLFSKLAENTLKTVKFNDFKYTYGGKDKIVITMTGEAVDYESMALQAKAMTDPNLYDAFQGPIFSNFNKVKDKVVFTFSSGINPFVIDYYRARLSALGQTGTASPSPGSGQGIPVPGSSSGQNSGGAPVSPASMGGVGPGGNAGPGAVTAPKGTTRTP